MIISNIIGGLGNQMFQYAAGKALAVERNQPLRLDISGFAGYGVHQGFELSRIFDCHAQIATESEVRAVLGWQYPVAIRRIIARPELAAFRRKNLIVEPHFHYWSGIKDISHDCFLTGYWQSEKYFRKISSEVRSDFTFKQPLAGKNLKLAEQIVMRNAVSLHVRRGDYVTNLKANETHGTCTLDYYQAAIRNISERVRNPKFYVFSDDMVWVKENLRINFFCEYVDHNQGLDSYNDMRLMSMCKHHIIANSSFSWWGAWLNTNQEKIVIAPYKWFSGNKLTQDLLPAGWVIL